jgi:Uma2 family endonuclease
MHAETATLDWLPDLFDSEEQDEPLAGQDHVDTIDSLSYPLRGRLSGPECFVAAELRVHRDPANLRDYKEPDVLVALRVPDRVRPRYDLWQEGKAPDLAIEVLSPSSVENKDLTEKRDWYRREGVLEYVVLDPSGDFAPEPRLQSWLLGRRADGSADVYQLAENGTLWSALIPFGWRVVDNRVRVVDRVNGELFPWITDVEPQLRREVALRQAAQEEAQRAQERALLAEEQARLADEQALLADSRERLAIHQARLAHEREQQAQAEVRQARSDAERAAERERRAQAETHVARAEARQASERADREAAARRALEEELARLRGQ